MELKDFVARLQPEERTTYSALVAEAEGSPVSTAGLRRRLARLVMRVSKIGLPNIIAGRAIVPELWQGAVTAENMAAQAVELLTNPMRNAAMRAALATIRSQLGAPGVAARVASGILEHLLTQTPCSVVGEAHHRVVLPER